MDLIGAGLAALGVIGPGIGIGILTGLAAQAIGRNPDATPQIRALIPAGMLLLEGLLNFVQALIFSTLMLMYTIIAVESHHTEEHEGAADVPEGGIAPPLSVGASSH